MSCRIKTLIWGCIILLAYGCSDIRDFEIDTRKDRDVALPLINTSISVVNFVNNKDVNTTIEIDEDGRVSLIYDGSIYSRKLDDLFINNIPIIGIPIEDKNTVITDLFREDQIIRKGTANANSEMIIGFTNPTQETIQVSFSLPQMFNQDEAFTAQYTVAAGEEFASEPYQIEGYDLIPENNMLNVNYTAIDASGNEVDLEDAVIAFRDLGFSFIEGYLGYDKFNLADERINITVFNNWINGTVHLEDPKVNMAVVNSFGFPIRARISKLDFVSDSTINSLESEFIDNGIDFNYPSLNEIGESRTTQFNFDNSNSNIQEIISESTDYIDYSLSVEVNPDKDQDLIGFGRETDSFEINLNAILPLYGTVDNLVLRDTVAYDVDDADEVNSIEFKLVTDNAFPADLLLNIYNLNEDGTLGDKLFSDIALNSPTLNADGKVTEAEKSTVFITKDKKEIEQFLQGEELLLELRLSTIDGGSWSIWVYEDFGVTVKLGAIVNFTLDE